MMSKEPLFSDFSPVSSKEYKQKIQYDLKGADYNETLVWHSDEGIHVKPFYHRDELENIHPTPGMPAQWHIGESVFILDAVQSARTANEAINDGAEAIYFQADAIFDVEQLFFNLKNKEVPLYFDFNFLDSNFYEQVTAFAKARTEASSNAQVVSIKLDLIGHLVTHGNWYKTMAEDHVIFNKLLLGDQKNVTVDTTVYQNAGATMVQQLAYGLAHLNECLNHCEQEGVTIETLTFEIAVGTNYFFEIAKLRAVRQLVDVLQTEYGVAKAVLKIIAHPTRRNKTIYDYNVNMLRTTTECMSAILGGANWVVNQPYDALYHKTNNFGQRISRNQLIILKEESYFDAVSNPADGAYYIEILTKQLAEKALVLFKDIESNGGFLKQLKDGTIQRKIKESAAKEQEQFDREDITLLGTNKHPNPDDKMKSNLELYPFLKIKPRKTIIEPIIPKRLAEALEQERLKNEVY